MTKGPTSEQPERDTVAHADVIVVGSGFGGAVAAARLAQAGQNVVVLERGRRWPAGSFPRRPDLDAGWLWEKGGGLYDIRWLDRMAVVQAAGLGGGSLAYANVFARPAQAVMDTSTAPHMARSLLDPYYDLAAHMLQVSTMPPDPASGRDPERTRLFEDVTRDLDVAEATVRPLLAVTFGDPDTERPNAHGVQQRGCRFVGECVIGCNHGAKNSLDMNYLAVAEREGATIVTGAEARRLERLDDGWAVITSATDDTSQERRYTATRLVLAAGAVATTELLLRARDVDGTLPGLSPTLGHGFSGNGDFLATTNQRHGTGDLTRGPTITTTTVLDVWEGRAPVWFQVQDGAIPPPLQDLLKGALPLRRTRAAWSRFRRTDTRRSFAVLGMGRDTSDGRLRLDDEGRVVLEWSNRRQARLYRAQRRVGPAIARRLGSPVRTAATWTLLRRPVTVHPLGGVPVGPDRTRGVVDALGEVHDHPGLYVFDGAAIPAATSVNPSATILAVAEHHCEALVRSLTGDPGWRAPEWGAVRPAPVPEDVAARRMAERRESTAGDGVRFAERMVAHDAAGGSAAELTLRARIDGLRGFADDPVHPVTVRGRLRVAGLLDAETRGTLELFPRAAPAMRYRLELEDDSGTRWHLEGVKETTRSGLAGLVRDLCTLDATIRPANGSGPGRRVTFRIPPGEVVRMLASLRGEGFTASRRLSATTRFAAFFTIGALRRKR
ncbi:GMC family oxidoreductase [Phycicoccus sp. BSK3Z-2]|uniref:Cholesterol oxidase n=1 Tax=Phycicoccus avicenniae TaxID=2828860 RepID=A0A941D655_9MICO|nr:GMC family oxidoreductase [Phycicoccus avicenniae]MBR7741843.1 GMC family oxidoreductase [Phycicoccus avicenniae]